MSNINLVINSVFKSLFSSLFNKIFDPIFDNSKERTAIFNTQFSNQFNHFYDSQSFQWPTRTFSYLPSSETLKVQSLYGKLVPLFECTSLIHINNRRIRLIQNNIFGQKQESTQKEALIDISVAPLFEWIRITTSPATETLMRTEFGISDTSKFQLLIYKIRHDYALMIATAQAEPWLKIKLDSLAEQIVLGFCDND